MAAPWHWVVPSHQINPLVMAKMPFDTYKDLTGVTMVVEAPLAFLVGTDEPAQNIVELTALCRRQQSSSYNFAGSLMATR